jgi:hypothetical protein
MGRKKRHRKKDRTPDSAPGSKGRWRVVAILAVVVGAAALAFMSWRSEPRPATEAARAAPARRPATNPAPRAIPSPAETASEGPAHYRPLLGEWVRPDGGYVLAITDIAADGKATVGYFNPRPINVGRAEARLEGDSLGLFVELRDQNYPGSTYTLAYDAEGDQLVGVYFQAVQRASYDVVFVRRP